MTSSAIATIVATLGIFLYFLYEDRKVTKRQAKTDKIMSSNLARVSMVATRRMQASNTRANLSAGGK